MARSAGGLNLWWMMGREGALCCRKGGRGELNWGKEEASSRILSARARLYSWLKFRDSEGSLGGGEEEELWNTVGNGREVGSCGGRPGGHWDKAAGGDDGESDLGMFS